MSVPGFWHDTWYWIMRELLHLSRFSLEPMAENVPECQYRHAWSKRIWVRILLLGPYTLLLGLSSPFFHIFIRYDQWVGICKLFHQVGLQCDSYLLLVFSLKKLGSSIWCPLEDLWLLFSVCFVLWLFLHRSSKFLHGVCSYSLNALTDCMKMVSINASVPYSWQGNEINSNLSEKLILPRTK